MTILSACQAAGTRLTGERPATLFATPEVFANELFNLAVETAQAISTAHDWRSLTRLCTIASTGTNTAFPLPADFNEFVRTGDIYSTRSLNPIMRARDLNHWIEIQNQQQSGYSGYWILLEDKINILPAPLAEESLRFYYTTRNIFADEGGVAKAIPTANTDIFRLSERLLTLGIIWRWNHLKRLEFAEDLRNFEILLDEEISRERAPGVLAIGGRRSSIDSMTAYPRSIVQ